jgi:hypothetical protein
MNRTLSLAVILFLKVLLAFFAPAWRDASAPFHVAPVNHTQQVKGDAFYQ